MTTLNKVNAKIEKKTASRNKVKQNLNADPDSCSAGEMRESLRRYREERDSLQCEFEAKYNKFN